MIPNDNWKFLPNNYIKKKTVDGIVLKRFWWENLLWETWGYKRSRKKQQQQTIQDHSPVLNIGWQNFVFRCCLDYSG